MKIKFLREVHSEKQRDYMCHMSDSKSKRPKGLSQDEAEEMCTGPMKEEQLDEISAMGAGSVAGGGGAFEDPEEITTFNEEEKKKSKLDDVPLEEMYSTTALSPGDGHRYPGSEEEEEEGRLERSRHQGLQNVKENLNFHQRWKVFLKS